MGYCLAHPEWMHAIQGCLHQRHNRLVDIIEQQLRDHVGHAFVTREKFITPELVTMDDEISFPGLFSGIVRRTPDLLVIDRRRAFLVEISCPFDRFVNVCYEQKFFIYQELCNAISQLGYRCSVVVLVVSSTGLVHRWFRTGLKILGIAGTVATAIARYCSVSAIIGSAIIWRQRVKRLDV